MQEGLDHEAGNEDGGASQREGSEAVLIDVREPEEFRSEHIASALSLPLSEVRNLTRVLSVPAGCKVVFQCLKGGRGQQACERLAAEGGSRYQVFNLEGGIAAWKAEGLPVVGVTAPRLTIFRQVQIAVGFLVLLSVLAGFFLTPAGFVVAGLFGAALAFAGISGWCGMAILLNRMPWNRSAA
ncbi:rhodanese-like domain-containing protein [Rhizobium sp. BK068]|uniref:rhodanese-like domain-containing protein n=1 Tax=Rhizobium sp. BK068 TaxID=2512130 RepID=UPI001047E91E